MESTSLFKAAISSINAGLRSAFSPYPLELCGLVRPVRRGSSLVLLPYDSETAFSLNGEVRLQVMHRLTGLTYAKGQSRGDLERKLRVGTLSLVCYGKLEDYARIEAVLQAQAAQLLNSDLDGRNVATRTLSLTEYNFERDLFALSYSVSELTPAGLHCLPDICQSP